MIKLKKIKKVNDLQPDHLKCDAFFFGKVIDDRTQYISEKISNSKYFVLTYVKDESTMYVNGESIKIIDFVKHPMFNGFKSIIIDSTSLDFPEILYTLFAIDGSPSSALLTILYIEPSSYSSKKGVFEEDNDFELSDSKNKFATLPLFSINSSQTNKEKNVLLSFLGFENSRLGQILAEDDGALYGELLTMVAVPAFKAGWENNSLRKHMSYFNSRNTKLMLYPGNNPYEVLNKLNKIYSAYTNIVIAAIGTKPSTLAAALFLVNKVKLNSFKQKIGAIHDFPIKSRGRSMGVGPITIYTLAK